MPIVIEHGENRIDGTGVLFERDKKGSRYSPDHTGEIKLVCPHCHKSSLYKLASWIKRKTGGQVISLLHNKYDPKDPSTWPPKKPYATEIVDKEEKDPDLAY